MRNPDDVLLLMKSENILARGPSYNRLPAIYISLSGNMDTFEGTRRCFIASFHGVKKRIFLKENHCGPQNICSATSVSLFLLSGIYLKPARFKVYTAELSNIMLDLLGA
jgi:hypothetical protein